MPQFAHTLPQSRYLTCVASHIEFEPSEEALSPVQLLIGEYMRKSVLAVLLLLCGISGAAMLSAQTGAQSSQGVKVFVDLEGSDPELANMYAAKLISHLMKHGISVVESMDDADAILHGSGLVQSYSTEYGHTRYIAQAGMRLVNKDGLVLWADDVRSSRYAESASTSFAENVAKSLEKSLSARPQKN